MTTQLIPLVNSNDHVSGEGSAVIEVVEYGDYQCPYCGRAYPIIKSIQERLGPQLRFVFRNFPLSKIHPHAFLAAVATEAAGLQDKFWEMHDIVFENQHSLELSSLYQMADIIGLDRERFSNDIQQQELIEKVEKDFESGIRSGVNGTPTFFINGRKYDGSWEEAELYQYLKNLHAKPSMEE
ncbi:thioredoxin domain-containing protein [Paraflavitalea sp. CAU 1676]|uniref:DsbA family protein n=1 Tax=Paraflavitalea sp. CAU 1676 TaxID=3032598 RepID=UPI0023DAC4AE|nr:thioredoxin domain-containing protein [Paraflavitalea sp. CAU 1676]MDF2186808.1 thioredoxin domain-containing protein [Paraflavitalea sp. CAU 1676]